MIICGDLFLLSYVSIVCINEGPSELFLQKILKMVKKSEPGASLIHTTGMGGVLKFVALVILEEIPGWC